MKYTKRFEHTIDRTNFLDSTDYVDPHASYTIQDEYIQYSQIDYSIRYFSFNSDGHFEVRLNPQHSLVSQNQVDIEYSFNLKTWYTLPSNDYISVDKGVVYLKGNNLDGLDGTIRTTEENITSKISLFSIVNAYTDITVNGNIMSLIYGDNFIDQLTIPAEWCFACLFYNLSDITSAKNLILPATNLNAYCYYSMFEKTLLSIAPKLSATTLTKGCYSYMFRECTQLTNAPVLPATILTDSCYNYMFYGCSNLNYVKAMFTTTPSFMYSLAWLANVSSTGTFVKNAAAAWDVTGPSGIPATWDIQIEEI